MGIKTKPFLLDITHAQYTHVPTVYTVCVCWGVCVGGGNIPGQVIKRCHPEASNHCSLPLFGQQFVPHSLLTALRMFNLNTQTEPLSTRALQSSSITKMLIFKLYLNI